MIRLKHISTECLYYHQDQQPTHSITFTTSWLPRKRQKSAKVGSNAWGAAAIGEITSTWTCKLRRKMSHVFHVLTTIQHSLPFSSFPQCRPYSPRRPRRYGEPSAQTPNALYLSLRGRTRMFCSRSRRGPFSMRTHLNVESDSLGGGCRRPAAAVVSE